MCDPFSVHTFDIVHAARVCVCVCVVMKILFGFIGICRNRAAFPFEIKLRGSANLEHTSNHTYLVHCIHVRFGFAFLLFAILCECRMEHTELKSIYAYVCAVVEVRGDLGDSTSVTNFIVLCYGMDNFLTSHHGDMIRNCMNAVH